jgi:amino acid transporter
MTGEIGDRPASAPALEWVRRGFWLLLIASWVVAVWYMWEAMSTIPSAGRLEETRLVEIPGPRRFFTAAAFSAMELALVLAALWPWRPAWYATRLGVTALGTITWFITTTPLDLSRMDWVHRRWLGFLIAAQLVALLAVLAYRGAAALAERRAGDTR